MKTTEKKFEQKQQAQWSAVKVNYEESSNIQTVETPMQNLSKIAK